MRCCDCSRACCRGGERVLVCDVLVLVSGGRLLRGGSRCPCRSEGPVFGVLSLEARLGMVFQLGGMMGFSPELLHCLCCWLDSCSSSARHSPWKRYRSHQYESNLHHSVRASSPRHSADRWIAAVHAADAAPQTAAAFAAAAAASVR